MQQHRKPGTARTGRDGTGLSGTVCDAVEELEPPFQPAAGSQEGTYHLSCLSASSIPQTIQSHQQERRFPTFQWVPQPLVFPGLGVREPVALTHREGKN